MDTETPIAAEITSAVSLPLFESRSVTRSETTPLLSTTSTTNEPGYSKEIVVRGTGTLTVTVTVNVASEALIQKNLAANRGLAVSETNTGHEG